MLEAMAHSGHCVKGAVRGVMLLKDASQQKVFLCGGRVGGEPRLPPLECIIADSLHRPADLQHFMERSLVLAVVSKAGVKLRH